LTSSARVGHRQLARLADAISQRDETILRLIAVHRYATTRQLQLLVFTDHASAASAARTCSRVLLRLQSSGLLDTLERRVGGIRAGSAGRIWHLTHAGSRLLSFLDGDGTQATRFQEPSQRLLDHSLMVTDIHLTLRSAAVQHGFEIVAVQHEPESWRAFTGQGGQRRLIRPDLFVVTATNEYEDSWALEADTGSEHPPTVVRSCKRYLSYHHTGIEQQAHGVFPRVIWVVPHAARAAKLDAAFRSARLDRDLFRITTLGRLVDLIAGGAG
jgi:hypothetical protein